MSGMLTRAGLRAFATQALKVVNDVAKQRFLISARGVEAQLAYEARGKHITFISTDVPKQFQGQGIGKILAKYAFDHAVNNKLDVICKCHFLAKYYENNKAQYKDLKIKMQLE